MWTVMVATSQEREILLPGLLEIPLQPSCCAGVLRTRGDTFKLKGDWVDE